VLLCSRVHEMSKGENDGMGRGIDGPYITADDSGSVRYGIRASHFIPTVAQAAGRTRRGNWGSLQLQGREWGPGFDRSAPTHVRVSGERSSCSQVHTCTAASHPSPTQVLLSYND
jgi:hypothetical protein